MSKWHVLNGSFGTLNCSGHKLNTALCEPNGSALKLNRTTLVLNSALP